jgi:hypothetical protein
MKLLTIILVVLISGSCVTQKTYIKKFNDKEQYFIKNVIRIAEEKPTSIVKRASDSHIVLEFPTQMWVLAPDGYVLTVCELIDGEWHCCGREEDAF